MNYNYFDSIDTEEKAYWLGFIFADGNISKSERIYKGKIKKGNYRFEVSLKDTDREHLEKFAKEISFEKEIKISQTNSKAKRCRLYFNNKHFWNTLNNYGCTPNKSLTLKFPNISIFKDTSLIKHFIRGYVDGDGSIAYKNAKHTDFQLRILGTEHFLSNLQKNLPLEKLFKTSDITYDVHFNYLKDCFLNNDILDIKFNTQLKSLVEFGILDLLEILKANVDEKTYLKQTQQVKVLLEPTGMGDRFKPLNVSK